MSGNDEKNALVEVGCAFWFNDNEQVRSPFPKEIQPEVKRRAQTEYLMWLDNLTDKDKEEVDDDEMVSVFEGFLFGEGLKMAGENKPDLALTLHFPFMPRVGDLVSDETRGESRVVERRVESKEDNQPFMIVVLQAVKSKETWQTEFMLPT
jgi:hypothetical protein